MFGVSDMGLLANFKIRTKIIIALLPLTIMVIVAVLYSSDRMSTIDAGYSSLIDKDVNALQDLTVAQSLNNLFGQILYKQIAETDSDRMRLIDADLDQTAAQFHRSIEEAEHESPNLVPEIKAAAELFDRAAIDSRSVRAATLAQDNQKAMRLMRESFDPELLKARQELEGLTQQMQTAVDRESQELTARTIHTIRITWIVIALGLLISFGIALSIVQVEVVKVVLSFRTRILEVAEGRLDQPIANLDRPNEIGEMSRALQTLQLTARERETQSWVKAEVAATTERLQSAEDFPAFATILLSRISEALDLLYGAFYLADENHARFRRVGAYATDVALEPG